MGKDKTMREVQKDSQGSVIEAETKWGRRIVEAEQAEGRITGKQRPGL
jgi:hypothetical protein